MPGCVLAGHRHLESVQVRVEEAGAGTCFLPRALRVKARHDPTVGHDVQPAAAISLPRNAHRADLVRYTPQLGQVGGPPPMARSHLPTVLTAAAGSRVSVGIPVCAPSTELPSTRAAPSLPVPFVNRSHPVAASQCARVHMYRSAGVFPGAAVSPSDPDGGCGSPSPERSAWRSPPGRASTSRRVIVVASPARPPEAARNGGNIGTGDEGNAAGLADFSVANPPEGGHFVIAAGRHSTGLLTDPVRGRDGCPVLRR